ncbi:MAG: histidine kinase [Phaeodactylibacter sp.]|nr:histidine kinase [Phaeodactylibacter sp.]MCB9273683.1 histidine kinase [Lewinellaceae bacterium]
MNGPITLALALVLTSSALAQRPSYRQYTVHEGLAQQQVTCLFQDSRGYIWAGTKLGLSKFDGEQFENFTEKDGLPHRAIWDIKEDGRGAIWVYTVGGLARYDGAEWINFPYNLVSGGTMIVFPNGRILLRGEGHKLMVFRDGVYSEVTDSQGATIITYSMCYDYTQQKALLSSKQFQLWEYSHGEARPLATDSGTVQGLLTIGDHCGYTAFNEKKNLFHIIDLQGSDTIFSFQGKQNPRQGFIPFFSGRRGIYFFYDQQVYQKRTSDSIARPLAITNMPTTLLEDAEGQIWAGTEFGLLQYFPDGFQYYSEEETPNPWGILEDSSGAYWSPQYRFGLYRFKDGETPRKVPVAIGGEEITSFYFRPSKDKRGNLYFPHSQGLVKYDGRTFAPALSLDEYTREGQPSAILASYYDQSDDAVLACAFGKTILIRPDGEKVFLENKAGSHQSAYVICAIRDKHDNYWFGSFNGLSRYHIPSRQMHYYLPEEGKLPAKGVLSLAIDGKGALWLGGLNGLYHFDYQADTVVPVDTAIFSSIVFSLNTVDSSLLLVAEMADVKAMDLSAFYETGELKVKNYNHRNGFMGIEPNQNCAYIDSRNRYWLPSSNGLYYIPVSDIKMDAFPSRVRVTELNGRKVRFQEQDGAIALPRGINQVQLNFESIGFAHPVRTQYSYRLLGRLQSWSPWQTSRSAFFANLPSGEYTFEVRSRHPAAIEEEKHYQVGRLQFQVALPFYQEPHFYKWSAVVTAVLLTLAMVFLYLVVRYFRRDRENQATIREKEDMIKYYQVQTLQAQLNPHFLNNALAAIQNYLRQEDRDAAINQLLRLAAMMRNFMESSIHADIGNIVESNSEIPLEKEIELLKYYIELMQIQYPHEFEYEINIGQGMEPSLAYIPPLIIQPFVENAIEHGLRHRMGKGRLWLSFSQENGRLLCCIEDDGIGRKAAAAMQRQSDRMYQSRGTRLVLERVALLKSLGQPVEIGITDREGGGTRVAIRFEMR